MTTTCVVSLGFGLLLTSRKYYSLRLMTVDDPCQKYGGFGEDGQLHCGCL